MKMTFAMLLVTSLLSTGLMSAPAYADKIVLKIGDNDRHDHWEHGRHHGWRENGWRHRTWFDDDDRYGFYRPPVVVRNVYVTRYDYNQPLQPMPIAWNNAPEPQRYCREYYGPARIGGRIVQTYGNACLQPDGSWQIVD